MVDIIAELQAMLPAGCVEKKSGVSEKGISFSIGKTRQEQVARISMDSLRPHLGLAKGERITDSVFVCTPSSAPQTLLIVMVELKGSDVGHAISQIEETAARLCKGSNRKPDMHTSKELRKEFPLGHGKRILGLVISRQGLSTRATMKAKLKNKGIILKYRKKRSFKLSELVTMMP